MAINSSQRGEVSQAEFVLISTRSLNFGRYHVGAGGMAEWSMAVVLKTTKVQAFGGSNPSPSVLTTSGL